MTDWLVLPQHDYSDPVRYEGRTAEMDLVTDAKFALWDRIVRENILENGTDEEKAKVFGFMYDPTIYAYAWFRDEHGNPFRLYSYQDLILNDPGKEIIFCAANQIGKSISLDLKALTFALTRPGKTVLMVSKTLPQCKDLLRRIKQFLSNGVVEYKYDIGDTETKTEIYFRHYEETTDPLTGKTTARELDQSRIVCVPATEAALGYPADLLLVDELAFYEEGTYFYKQVARPRTYTTKGQIIVFSNPNGEQGIFWELWNNKYFHKYRFTFLDKPGNTQEEFDRYCESLTQQEIDSTLLAVFTSPEGGFLTYTERKMMQEDRPNSLPAEVKEPLYIFFDFAKTVDRTVRATGVPIGNVTDPEGVKALELKEYPHGTPYTDILDELDALIKRVGSKNVAMVGWDNTGVGGGIEDFIMRLQLMGISCMPVDFTLQNKSRIYTMFKLLVERNAKVIDGIPRQGLKIPFIPECDKQLASLRFTVTSRNYLQVHHEKERQRDDFPDAIAGLCSLIINPENAPVSVTIVNESINQEDEDKREERFGAPLGVV